MWFFKKPKRDPAPVMEIVDAATIFARWQSFADNDIQSLRIHHPLGDSVLEKALWTMCTARLDSVVGFTTSWIKDQIDTEIAPLIYNHATALNRQYQNLHKKDRYGVIDDSGWLSEKEYFIEQIIAPILTELANKIKTLYRGMGADDTAYNEAFDTFDDNYLTNDLPVYHRHVPLNDVQKLRDTGAVRTINALFWNWLVSRDPYGNADKIMVILNGLDQMTLRQIDEIIEGVITGTDTDSASTDDSHDVFRMSPYDYEEYCADILNKNGWTATATKKSGDQGADVYAEKDGISVVIQCKLTNTPVGNKAVQEIISGQKYMAADYAVVVSPATYTPGARDLAKTAHVLLLDHDDLKDLAHIITLSL